MIEKKLLFKAGKKVYRHFRMPCRNCLVINVVVYLSLEDRVKNINDFKKPEEIRKLLENKYNEEVVNKVKDFYFNDNGHDDSEQNNLENICHVCIYIYLL